MNIFCKVLKRVLIFYLVFQGGLFAQNQLQPDSIIIEQLDKLMNSWYAKKAVYHEKSQTPFQENISKTENNDSLVMLRLKSLTEKTVFPMVYNDEIKAYINVYTKRKQSVSLLLGLAKYYFPMFEETLDKYGCPLELRYLAVIESALNPNAVSRAGATGLWQFMYQTGKIYGLEVNTLLDYRRDPIKATDAAARHLRDLSETFFGDWVLAMAAYNCGAGNVTKAILRSGGKTDFWDIYKYLPKETRGYIPAFYGAWYAMQYYDKYDIEATPIKFGQTDTLHIDNKVHFQQIEAVLGIPVDELKALNPQYKKNIIPLSEDVMTLVLPVEYIHKFVSLKDSIYNYNVEQYFSSTRIADNIFNTSNSEDSTGEYRTETRRHVVKSGESLSIIARKYNTTPSVLANLNKMSMHATIHPGQNLIVGYKKIPIQKKISENSTSNIKDTTTASEQNSIHGQTVEENSQDSLPPNQDNQKTEEK